MSGEASSESRNTNKEYLHGCLERNHPGRFSTSLEDHKLGKKFVMKMIINKFINNKRYILSTKW